VPEPEDEEFSSLAEHDSIMLIVNARKAAM
ncbi:uncharacterized protein METZ01_LOCUS491700, partial [marine metagenome]